MGGSALCASECERDRQQSVCVCGPPESMHITKADTSRDCSGFSSACFFQPRVPLPTRGPHPSKHSNSAPGGRPPARDQLIPRRQDGRLSGLGLPLKLSPLPCPGPARRRQLPPFPAGCEPPGYGADGLSRGAWRPLSGLGAGVCPSRPLSFLSLLSTSCLCSVTQSCPTLCDPMDCSTPGLPVHHQLPEFTQTHAC